MFVQVLDENSQAFFNFINSLGAQHTRESYRFRQEKFLSHYGRFIIVPKTTTTGHNKSSY